MGHRQARWRRGPHLIRLIYKATYNIKRDRSYLAIVVQVLWLAPLPPLLYSVEDVEEVLGPPGGERLLQLGRQPDAAGSHTLHKLSAQLSSIILL